MSYVLILIIIAAFSGGSAPVFGKLALAAFQPFTAMTIRFFFASIVLLPFIKKEALSLDSFGKNWKTALVGAMNPLLFFIALPFIQTSVTPLIYGLVPLFTATYNRVVCKKTLQRKQIIGLAIGFIGVSIIVLLPLLEKNPTIADLKGNAAIVIAAIAFTAYAFMSKNQQETHDMSAITLTFHFCIMSLFISIPLAAYELAHKPLQIGTIGMLPLFSGVYIGIVGTAIFYLTFQQALRLSSELTASLFTYLQPFSTISLAILLLSEHITFPFILGGALSVLGATLVSRK
ncbi:DMT family transporter [soil metagenome]